MPIAVRRLDLPSLEEIREILDSLGSRDRTGRTRGCFAEEALSELPVTVRAVLARDEAGAIALLLMVPGFLERWAVPSDLLGANPILPLDKTAARIHAALLSEASAWIDEEGESGLEILLPMGSENMRRDDRRDAFFEGLGFRRSFYTMTRRLDVFPGCERRRVDVDAVPAAAFPVEELYANYTSCTAAGEVELVSKQRPGDRRGFFESLLEDTLGQPASLALTQADRLVGFALVASLSAEAAHLGWIGILPGERRRGLGRQLLCRVMETCKEHQIERMSLYTDTPVGSQTLYHSLGFSVAGTLTYRWRASAQTTG